MPRGPKRSHSQDHELKARRLERHIGEIGLDSEDAYRAWCLEHGFGKDLHKSRALRAREIELAVRLRGEEALSRKRRGTRHPQNTITALFERRLGADDLGADYLDLIRAQFGRLESDPDSRRALHDLLVRLQRYGSLFGTDPAIPFLGPAPGNTYIEAVAALARHHRTWIREAADWRPPSKNPRRQFSHLARHLLATYDVPFFVDAAWFQEDQETAALQQGWFRHIGDGGNIRTADIPVRFTKKMAHAFFHAPEGLPIERALRWGQVVGQGGGAPLARAVMGSRLGGAFAHEDFWETVIKFFVNNPMIDPSLVGPIVDFIHARKFVPREIVRPGGHVERLPPTQPNFAVKGRSADKLLGLMEEWHEELGQEFAAEEDTGRGGKAPVRWDPSGMRPLQIQEENPRTGETLTWMVQELTSSRELVSEGRAMHHCVASYAKTCRKGTASIWSLQAVDENKQREPVMTIAVDIRRMAVTQVRGRYNIAPVGKAKSAKQQSLNRGYLQLLKRSQRILKRWMTQEGLTLRC